MVDLFRQGPEQTTQSRCVLVIDPAATGSSSSSKRTITQQMSFKAHPHTQQRHKKASSSDRLIRRESFRTARFLILACVVAAFPAEASAELAPASEPRILVTANLSAYFASLDGSLQTPFGGAKGTTSSGRPTVDEVGLDGLGVHLLADMSVTLFGRHSLHVSYVGLAETGSKRLDRNLISQGQTFFAGSRAKSRLEMPLVRVGYRADWLRLSNARFSLVPEIGAARLDFAYRLTAPGATGKVNRAYVVYFAYWGVQLRGSIYDRLTAELDLYASAGLSNVVSIESDLRLLYSVWQSEHLEASLLLGVRGLWLNYKDDQRDEQNHINVRSGAYSPNPWAGLHLGVRFLYSL
jgi:hypothetical protein